MLTVIESKRFSLDAADLFTDAQLARLITFLSITPEAGDIIQGTGGLPQASLGGGGQRKARRCADYLPVLAAEISAAAGACLCQKYQSGFNATGKTGAAGVRGEHQGWRVVW